MGGGGRDGGWAGAPTFAGWAYPNDERMMVVVVGRKSALSRCRRRSKDGDTIIFEFDGLDLACRIQSLAGGLWFGGLRFGVFARPHKSPTLRVRTDKVLVKATSVFSLTFPHSS